MITITVDPSNSSRLVAIQDAQRPRVYLDMAPLMDIAADAGMRSRFVRALRRREGTLLLSFIHLVEMTKVAGETTVRSVEGLLVDLDRHYAFIEVIPETIAWKHLCGVPFPELDGSMLRAYLGELKSVDPFDPRGFLEFLSRSSRAAEIRQNLVEAAERTALLVEKVREDALSDKKVRRRLDRRPDAKSGKHPVEEAHADLTRLAIKDSGRPFTAQDMSDIFHTTAALMYVDYLVLDKGWADLAGSTAARLRKAGISAPTARIYRAGDLTTFLGDFDV